MISTARICRDCGNNEQDRTFVKGKRLCLACHAARCRKSRKLHQARYTEKRTEYVERNFKNWLRVALISINNTTKRRKSKRGLEFTITLDDLMTILHKQDARCAITGLEMTHKFGELDAASIDRVDSTKGYVPENVQLVCKAINLGKNTSSNEAMLTFIAKLRECTRVRK